ncbi:dihydroorotase [Lacinutrix sp. C3R15]|uniref:dihydroorotase n=1 Tax=Flavobacteriaceae TaxID=49546 RepID=UPI001C09D50F|nr:MULTISPECIES: dihydroorotase [Flavobacteriaceae]MBU2938672.1 dihydroorotase [Lacinutrix sp. C3R15]MDO6621986.1 dihydroorotase [Oceanihabitans sp. 1_MG-2023]
MNVILKSATIIDSKSEFHNTVQDILIENGVISKIAKNIKNIKDYKEISLENLHLSQGWFDSSVCFGEPGFEDRETINNGLQAAALSGFTTVAMNANTHPVLDTSADIAFVKSKAQNHAVTLLPIGALTNASKGEHLAELFDMKNAGSCAYQDYKKPIANANMLKIALQYASNFDGLVYSYPQDNTISRNGVVNENITSTTLGLKGNPNLAEALQVARDLFLLEYTNGKLHIPTISTAEAVALIREAKKKKLNVSCSVAIHNLFFTDDVLTNFDTNYKVQPPLRIQKDVDALIEGVKDGTIDMVTSDHNPLNIELKNIEFDYAGYGTIGLESAFGALNTLFSTKKAISLLTKGKDRFGLENTVIAEGNKINATLFNPNTKYTFQKSNIHSKSNNSIFLNTTLKGRVYGIIANNKMILN